MSAGTSRPRLGFLGVGWIGRNRLEAVAASGAAAIAAVADPCPSALAEALRLAPGARAACGLDELLELGLDGIVIATPSALHAEQSIRALERGLAVFCQKPLGRDRAEAERVVAAARAADRLLELDLSYRHTEAMQRMRSVAAEGGIGAIHAIDLVFHNAYGPDKPWFSDRALSGGGCAMDLGVHLVDLALWMLDFPEVEQVTSRLYAKGRLLGPRSSAVEDYAMARLDLASGATAQLTCSWWLPAGCDAVISARFYGSQGGLALRNVAGSFYDFVAERYRGTARETLAMPPDDWGGRAAVAWAERLARDRRFSPEAERLVEVAGVLDRIYERA